MNLPCHKPSLFCLAKSSSDIYFFRLSSSFGLNCIESKFRSSNSIGVDEKYISLSRKNLNRRVKNNSNFKNNWYDQKISEKYKEELRRLGFQIENESRWLNAVTLKCSKSDLSKISNLSVSTNCKP